MNREQEDTRGDKVGRGRSEEGEEREKGVGRGGRQKWERGG